MVRLKGELVKEYLSIAYPDKIYYTKVWPYEVQTPVQASHYFNLNTPKRTFLFSCDSIFDFENNELNSKQNWIGLSKDTNPKDNFDFGQSEDMNFRSVLLDNKILLKKLVKKVLRIVTLMELQEKRF